jgi:hypothetical protein
MGVFAQVAGGAGRGMIENVNDRRTDATAADLRAHQETLVRMRETGMNSRQEDTQAHDIETHGIAREETLSDLGALQEYDAGLLSDKYERDDITRAEDHANALELQDRKNTGAISLAEVRANPSGWKPITTKIIDSYNEFGDAVYVEKEISFQPSDGKYYEQVGDAMLPYDLSKNIPENQRALVDRPTQGMNWALTNGGAESLPSWYKVAHPERYEAIKTHLAKQNETENVAPVGGGNKVGGTISEGAAARDAMTEIEVPPARSPEARKPKPTRFNQGPKPAEPNWAFRNPFYTPDAETKQ